MKIRDWIDLARIELRREEGQTMTEYGVLLALIAVGVIAVLIVLGPKIADAFTSVLQLAVGRRYAGGPHRPGARRCFTPTRYVRRKAAAK